jgi:hypothetical protein
MQSFGVTEQDKDVCRASVLRYEKSDRRHTTLSDAELSWDLHPNQSNSSSNGGMIGLNRPCLSFLSHIKGLLSK